MKLVIEIYESDRDYPAVTHIFEGSTEQEVRQYANAHMKYDLFLHDAVNKGSFGKMKVKTNIYYA
jgi:hypothetical protein